MTLNESRSARRPRVLIAVGVVVALAALFGLRLLAGARLPGIATRGPAAPSASVPAPKAAALSSLEFPCWGCPEAEKWAVTFRTDLDLLAPLGNGPANAGLFFKDFAKPGGSRFAEATAAMERRVDGPPELGKLLPPDDPLLLEAEPWCDQATMRYYPDFFPLEGYDTQLPNLLVPLTLAKSWVARGLARKDPALAMDDFRRAIRLGRLFRQEDATIISDLVGLACIRHGAQGVYDFARRTGDAPLALVAATLLGEHAPQRLRTAERVTKAGLGPYLREDAGGDLTLRLPDSALQPIVDLATSDPERRFRGEGIVTLSVVGTLGTEPQKDTALATLRSLAESKDASVSALATWNLAHRPTKASVKQALAPISK
ncbi:MAG: hypothetical protein HY900_08895 [Deltaproteobacteria bacterium]|nr:hypothetical protein [Deltaproteobacteria bacterium]